MKIRPNHKCPVGNADSLDQIRKAKTEAAKQEKAREVVDLFKPIEKEFLQADQTSADCAPVPGKVVLNEHRRRGKAELWAARALAVGTFGVSNLADRFLFNPNDVLTGVSETGKDGRVKSLDAVADELKSLTFGGDFTPEYTHEFKITTADDGSRIYRYFSDDLFHAEKYAVKEKDGKLELVEAKHRGSTGWYDRY